MPKSTYHGSLDAHLTAAVVDEVTLVGSRCGPFAPALRLLEQGLVDVLPLIHAHYPLSEALVAFDQAARPETLKLLVDCTPCNSTATPAASGNTPSC